MDSFGIFIPNNILVQNINWNKNYCQKKSSYYDWKGLTLKGKYKDWEKHIITICQKIPVLTTILEAKLFQMMNSVSVLRSCSSLIMAHFKNW